MDVVGTCPPVMSTPLHAALWIKMYTMDGVPRTKVETYALLLADRENIVK